MRDAAPGDLKAISAIYAHHVLNGTGTFEEEPPNADEMSIRLARVRANHHDWIVATDDELADARGPAESIVGYGYVSAFRDRSAYRFTVEDSLYVHPNATGRGIGTLMLDELIRRSTAAGMRRMVAVIGDSANEASIRVHRSAGFRDCGLVPAMGWKFDRWLDVVFMDIDLGDGAASPPAPSSSVR
jgi:L-amino acid N-acyltransferase YncA